MPRTPILVCTLFSFASLFACGGGEKKAEEPKPAMADQQPAEEQAPPTEEAPPADQPAEAAPAEPPAPEPKKLSEDLDGDGTPEEVTLAGNELSIGEAKVTLSSEKLTPEKAASVELKVIDINKKDKSKELVVVDPGTGSDMTWWVISYNGKDKTASEPVEIPVGTEPTIKGNGQIMASMSDCGQTISMTWKLSKKGLSKGKEKKKGKRDESKCAGAPAKS